ncbi:MAG: hypothetical protein AAGF71_07615, partial [Pseudomonadota bacterium]
MIKTIATVALTAAISATAFAASANNQLAASLGVEPGVHSSVELVRLKNAIEENNTAEVAFILNGAETGTPVVSKDGFSGDELVRLLRAQEDNNTFEVSFIRSGVAAEVTQNVSVDADGFTAAERVRLRRAMEDNNTQEVNFILG